MNTVIMMMIMMMRMMVMIGMMMIMIIMIYALLGTDEGYNVTADMIHMMILFDIMVLY